MTSIKKLLNRLNKDISKAAKAEAETGLRMAEMRLHR